jgi:hypothetical protein
MTGLSAYTSAARVSGRARVEQPAPPPILSFISDFLTISSDLLTGKSVPVLVGIARLPIDQSLAGIVLSMGAVSGALFSHYTALYVKEAHALGHANRLAQLSFALWCSLSMSLSLSRGIHYGRGVILSLVPSFCVASQALPRSGATTCFLFLLSVVAYGCCLGIQVQASEARPVALEPIPSVLRGMTGGLSQEAEAVGVWDTVVRALQLFVLAFYACVQHEPTHVLFTDRDDPGGVCASPYYARHPYYRLFVGLTSGLVRVCLWYGVCSFTDNSLHAMLENDLSRGAWSWAASVVYRTALLAAASWTATLIRSQVLPAFGLSSVVWGLKLLVGALALAALYRQGDFQVILVLTVGLSCWSVATTALTIQEW